MSRMSRIQEARNAVVSGREGSAALEYNKKTFSTPDGYLYEERTLALVFLRCLRGGLVFQLSANNSDAGKFDDVVLVWRSDGDTEARTLLVQLKHKTSSNYTTLEEDVWLSKDRNSDFDLSKYCSSYGEISKKQDMGSVTCVLVTNARLGSNSLKMFVSQKEGSIPGLELLQAGGKLYKLNRKNQKVLLAVCWNTSFMEHFYLLCQQTNEDVGKKVKELLRNGGLQGPVSDELLRTGGLQGPVSDELCEEQCKKLCESLRHWMNHESVWLTRDWRKWKALVTECVRKEVTDCRAVTTSLKFCSVADVWRYVQSHNPAWVRPPERGTQALSATKVHQALGHEKHIVVAAERYMQLRHKILYCWGSFCPWLVIVDDDRESATAILDDVVTQVNSERRLVIVSSRGNNYHYDKYNLSDVSDDKWNEYLNMKVRLNGDSYECHLRDLVEDVDALKSLLVGKPTLLLTLAQLSQPLRLGRDLQPLPAHYVARKLVDQQLLTDEFFSTLDTIREYGREQVKGSGTKRNTVIVEGKPGVGKSKMLSHVALKIKERVPGCWIVRVNLMELSLVFKTSKSPVEDILRMTAFNKGELGILEGRLLRHSLGQSSRVVFLVDGFDEICPDYVDKCLELLRLLASGKGKLLVTTRPSHTKLLEAEMKVSPGSSLSLKPFSYSEREKFFALHPSTKKMPPTLNLGTRSLLKIPLFAEMFADVSQEVGETFNIVTLYEAFFRKKFRRLYEEKRGVDLSKSSMEEDMELLQKTHEEQLMRLAASVLLDEFDVPEMPSSKRENFVKAGIVYGFANGKPLFVHRTFAEHFLAKWCFHRDGERFRARVYREVYANRGLQFFRESFDRRAVSGQKPLETLLEAVLDQCNMDKIRAALDAGAADPTLRDPCGRNVLHLEVAYGAWCISCRLPLGEREWWAALSAKDDLLGWTPHMIRTPSRWGTAFQ